MYKLTRHVRGKTSVKLTEKAQTPHCLFSFLPASSDNFLFYRVSVSVVSHFEAGVSECCSLAPSSKLRLVPERTKWAHSSQLKDVSRLSLAELSLSIVGIILGDDENDDDCLRQK